MPDRDGTQQESLAIVVTGPVGVGKSTTAMVLADLLEAADIPTAYIDMDYLRWVSHRPADDPFHERLGYRNLAAVAANDRDAGTRVFTIAAVVESSAGRQAFQDAIPGANLVVVRLRVPLARVVEQIRGRNEGDALEWHLRRAPELERIMDAAGIGSAPGDFIVSADGETPEVIAKEIAIRLGLT